MLGLNYNKRRAVRMPESERVLVAVSDDGSQGKCREVCSESGRRHRFRVCGVGREVTGGTGGLGMSKGRRPYRYRERALIALVIRTQPMQPLCTAALSMTTRPSGPVSPLRDAVEAHPFL